MATYSGVEVGIRQGCAHYEELKPVLGIGPCLWMVWRWGKGCHSSLVVALDDDKENGWLEKAL